MNKTIYAISTMDSKGEEIAYIAECIKAAGAEVFTVDVGTKGPATVKPDIDRGTVAACHADGAEAVLSHTDRGQAVIAMSQALTQFILKEYAEGKVGGIIGIGGSGGTSLITPAMQAVPVGLPKLMVSTVASGNTAPYVGCSDVTMMYSVVDVSGINRVSKVVLGNAANAVAGMVSRQIKEDSPKLTVGMTMFGVTTPCCDAVRKQLEEAGSDCLVFHATGTGGQAMEKLVESGMIDAVLDLTTTEVADEVVGGVMSAGPERFDRIIAKEIPYVVSLGALDMVNFGAIETVPEVFKDRNLYVHNAQVTLMRTTPDENKQFAAWISGKLNNAKAPVTVLIPEKGVSILDAPDQPFYDPEADKVLFDELENALKDNEKIKVIRIHHNINDPEFADAVIEAYRELADK